MMAPGCPTDRWWVQCVAVLWTCLLGVAAQPDGQYLVELASFSHSQSTTVNNTPSIALGTPLFTTTYTLTINSTFVTPPGPPLSTPQLKVKLTPPYQNVAFNTGCKLYVTGNACATTSYTHESYIDMPELLSTMSVTTSPAVMVEQSYNSSTGFYVDYDFGVVSINSSISDPDKTITFVMTTRLLSQSEDADRVTAFDFQGEFTVTHGNSLTTFTNTSSLGYLLKRPLVQISYSANPAILASLVTSTVTITIDHSQMSTDTASNLQVALAISGSVAAYNGDAKWSKDGGTKTSSTDLSMATGSATSLNTGSHLTITYSLTAPNLPPLNAAATATVTVTYGGLFSNGSQKVYDDSFSVRVHTPGVDMTTGAVDDVTLGTSIPAGSSITISRTMSVPRGIIKSLAFGSYFSSDVLNPIPLEWLSSTVTSPSTTVTFSNPTLINVGPNGFTNINSRRRRATTASLASTRSVGHVTNTGTGPATVKLQVVLAVNNVVVGGALTAASTYISIGGVSTYLSAGVATITRPILTMKKTAEVDDVTYTPDRMKFSLLAEHDPQSNAPAYDVKLYGGNDYFDVYWRDGYVGPALSSLVITNNRKFTWPQNSLVKGANMNMVYKAAVATKQELLPDDSTWINATVTYKSSSTSSTTYAAIGACCITKVDIGATSMLINHGFTVMALIFGVILGLLIIILVMFIIVKVLKKIPFSCCPGAYESELESKTTRLAMGGGLVMDTKMAVTKSYYSAKDVARSLQESIGESIVGILRWSDRFRVQRELDNRDIQATIYVDTQIEEERDEAMAATTVNLIKGLQANGDIPNDVMDKCLKKFKKGVADLDKNMEGNFRNELGDIYDRLQNKNREKLANLLAMQQEEEEDLQDKTKDLSAKEREDMLKLTHKKHETEKNELTYLLKLEQDEEAEKLRKEFTIRKRMGVKELQQDTLDEIKKDAKLTDQQADWLLKEYLKNQAGLDKLYDDEISRQRMVLEEKLSRRRALAAQAEAQEEHQTEMLNTLATQQMQAINKMKKEKVLSPDEAQALIDEAHEGMMAAKKRMDQERETQEDELQRKLSERKKKKLEEQAKKHQQEKSDMEKKHKSMQSDSYVDPLSLLEEQQYLYSIHRSEVNQIENEVDKEHADELLKLREQLGTDTRVELESAKDELFGKLKQEGMSEDQADKIISKHRKDMARLEQTQQEERERQQEEFKKTLAKRKKEWASRREDEKKQQEQLREHEDQVVRKLMDNQVAISEDERDRIMQEHEKQMVKLENSLTLNKLQGKRMLEERLAKKRAQQLEKLQKKQTQETKKVNKQMDADSELDDDERYQQELDMMKKHAEQRIAILQGEKIELEDEMDVIRDEMLKERASALKEQEVQLGTMLAALQMEKAKEMARIEEQQKAIHDLKANLLEDLHSKGILTEPKCQQVIEMHRKEQEKLQMTLDAQRTKQEKKFQLNLQKRLGEKEELLIQHQENEMNEIMNGFENDEALKRRLQDRLAQKAANLATMQDQQIHDVGAAGNTPAARIRRVALKHKHMMEMEQFRNRMEKEINQTLEDVRRQNDMRRIQDLQNQELQFINGLVRLGTFKMEELEEVLAMLFPLKSEEEKKKMLATLTEGYKPREDKKDEGVDEVDGPPADGTLVDRVKSARYDRVRSARSARGSNEKKKQQGTKKKKRLALRQNEDRPKSRFGKRPEPVGRSNSPEYNSDEDRHPRKYPSAKNTKKKFARRNDDDDDDYYEY